MIADQTRAHLRRLKLRLRRFRRLRSAYYLVSELRGFLVESPAAVRGEMDSQYAASADPWNYASSSVEQQRYAAALDILARWRGEHRPSAFEVGCGEGLFTARLAQHCSSVLAVDISDVALNRARETCAELAHVRLARWDAVKDPPPGTFDLVVCMDVMEVGWRPLAQRRAMRAVTRSLRPGGALLVTVCLRSPVVERARWGRWLGRGAHGVVARFASLDRRLICRESRSTERQFIALLEATD